MKTITLSIEQVCKWPTPETWMVGGYSRTQDIYVFPADRRQLELPAGGWTLDARDLLQIAWPYGTSADQEGMYLITYNKRRAYQGLWRPRLRKTVTESFFFEGRLWVLNYRLLRVEGDDDKSGSEAAE